MTSTAPVIIGSITVGTDGSSSYELEDCQPAAFEWDTSVSESKRVDYGVVTSTRRKITAFGATVRVTGSSLTDLESKIAALVTQIDALSITVTDGGLDYDCFPQRLQRARNATLMEVFADTVALQLGVVGITAAGS
jgi:hypothetical protein